MGQDLSPILMTILLLAVQHRPEAPTMSTATCRVGVRLHVPQLFRVCGGRSIVGIVMFVVVGVGGRCVGVVVHVLVVVAAAVVVVVAAVPTVLT